MYYFITKVLAGDAATSFIARGPMRICCASSTKTLLNFENHLLCRLSAWGFQIWWGYEMGEKDKVQQQTKPQHTKQSPN